MTGEDRRRQDGERWRTEEEEKRGRETGGGEGKKREWEERGEEEKKERINYEQPKLYLTFIFKVTWSTKQRYEQRSMIHRKLRE